MLLEGVFMEKIQDVSDKLDLQANKSLNPTADRGGLVPPLSVKINPPSRSASADEKGGLIPRSSTPK